jgi:acetyltransferase-like isoleucine patch superfamily enzyme
VAAGNYPSASVQVDPAARIASSASLDAGEMLVGPDAVIEDGVQITGRRIVIAPGARIGVNAKIHADSFDLGYRSVIEAGTRIGAIGGAASRVSIGDNSLIGASCTILLPTFVLGDYVALHQQSLTTGYAPCVIGHNTWIGQNSVLNCTEKLVIGNNVGIGVYTSIYTHAYNGELLEGCQIWQTAPVVIEDNAWLVGSYNVISPGVTVGSRSMTLTGSVVSKNVRPMSTVAGVPARDLTDRLVAFKEIDMEEKLALMRGFISEFAGIYDPAMVETLPKGHRISASDDDPFVVEVLEHLDQWDDTGIRSLLYVGAGGRQSPRDNVVVFDIESKTYSKRLFDQEINIIRFMNGYRARFVPSERPVVTAD